MKKKIVSILLILVLIIGINGLRVNAATDACKISLVTTVSSVEPGETIDIELKMTDITDTDGLAAYSAKIEFDTNAFTYSKIAGAGEWETPIYNEGSIAATVTSGNGQTTDQTIAVLTLNVNSDVAEGKYKVSISDIKVSNGVDTLEIPAVEKEITVAKETQSDNDNTIVEDNNTIVDDNNTSVEDNNTIVDDNNTSVEDNNTVVEDNNTADDNNIVVENNNTSKNNTSVSTNSNNENTSDKAIPYAGIKGAIIPVVIIATIACIVSYRKYRNSI